MIVLIPAYEPDDRLVALVHDLLGAAPDVRVVVVDDGSGPGYRTTFDRARGARCTVLAHAANRGKGAALKTGFAHVEREHPHEAVVCADSDGQHSVADVLRVAAVLAVQPADRPATVLGWRSFAGPVPARSVVGNRVAVRAFHLATGMRLRDTQTGLRGYPAALLPRLRTVPGERFEYELNLLLRAAAEGWPVQEVEIATIYLDANASSHFRPVRDSVRVLAPLLRFSASSLLAFAVDTVALLVLHAVTGSLLGSVVGARLLSAVVNFAVNRRLVFRGGPGRVQVRRSAGRYTALAVTLLGASSLLLAALTGIGVALLPAKIAAEVAVSLVGFQVQRRFVFGGGAPEDEPGADVASPAVPSTGALHR